MQDSRSPKTVGFLMLVSSLMALFLFQIGISTSFADDLVKKAQESMVAKGIDPGPIDGIWGPLTRGGVIEFQKRAGLTVSGRLDDATKKLLFSTPETPPSNIKVAKEPVVQEKPKAPVVHEVKQKEEQPQKTGDKPETESKREISGKASVSANAQTGVGKLPRGIAGKGKYEEDAVSAGGSISGVIHFSGNVPAPIMEDLNKGKNVEFCATHPDTQAGNIRPRLKVGVTEGKLKDSVVFIQNIGKGKAWPTQVNNFDFKTCDIFPKVSVVRKTPKGMKTGLLTITNRDEEILHNPHGYSVAGASRKTLFNKPLPSKGDVADVTKNFKRFKVKKDKHFFLQCDQHNFMEADARVVWNPYYSISGAGGAFMIDRIPAGKYWVTAWHPYLGEVSREVTVSSGADLKTDFEFVGK